MPVHLRNRRRLRRKELAELVKELEAVLGCQLTDFDETTEFVELEGNTLILLRNKAVGLYLEKKPFLTAKGFLMCQATKRFVTVDMGAVKFIVNGADVMAPGIVDADQEIKQLDAVWVRDEKNLRPLAVGIALMDGQAMKNKKEGKAIKTVQFVGDKIWGIGEKE